MYNGMRAWFSYANSTLANKTQTTTRHLTRWVPCDGYIRHQNDHLSGRTTDTFVMGEWQVAGVGGTRPLPECLKGRFSFEARDYLFSFQGYVHFEEFFCFPCFCKIWRQTFELWGFWFRRCLGAVFENCAPSPFRAIFTTFNYDHEYFFENFHSILKAEPESYGDSQAEQSTSVMVRRKQEQKLDLRDKAQENRWSSSRLVRVTCGDPWSKRDKNTAKFQASIVYKTSKFWGSSLFRDLISLPFCTSLFSCT